MSVLPNNTLSNPYNSFYALAGQGADDSLQSPASVIPAGDGSTTLTLAATTGNSLLSVTANPGIGRINVDGTNAMVTIGEGAGTLPLAILNDGTGILSIQSGLSANLPDTASFDMVNNIVNIVNPLAQGSVFLNAQTTVTSSGTRPAPSGITLTPTSPTVSNIGQAVASAGSLVLGSSIAFPDVLTVLDATGSAKVEVGGNTGSSIVMTGGIGASQTSNITTSATGVGSLLLGASVANDRAIFINDTGGAANTAVVDITKGTATGVALRLQGYGTGADARVTTNLGTSGGGILSLSSGYNDTSPAIVISDSSTSMQRPMTIYSAPTAGAASSYQGITQQIINGGNPIGTTPYPLTNPSLAGVYTILVRVGTAAAININGQISVVGYWDGTVWVAGGVNISPPLGTGNLNIWFGTTATTRTTLLLQNTGSAELSGVAVYMIPQLYGLSSVIT